MTKEQEINLQVLAYGLNTESSVSPPKVDAVDWYQFYHFCESQAIISIGLQCLDKLKKDCGSNLIIPQELLFRWIGDSEQIKFKNQLLNKRTQGLTEYFKEKGKRCCILKGQGNALMYPDPLFRTPGDLDVWLEGSKKEIVAFVHRDYPQSNVEYHHMQYPLFDDVEVEVHYYPSFCYNKWYNYKLLKFFRESSDAQFSNRNSEAYSSPTVVFNLVFQLSHMMRHFFTQGIGLRHAIDYFYLLKQELTKQQKEETVTTMKHCGMYKFFRAMMWIEKEVLLLNMNTDIAEPHERAGKMVLREMLRGGNFGKQYDHKRKGMIASYAEQILYNLRYLIEFPSEPLARPMSLIWDYIFKHFNFCVPIYRKSIS